MKPLTYLLVAEMELTEAAQHYETQQSGVGRAFLDAARDAGERIRRNPERWSYYEKPVRGLKVGPFPYRLLYRELADVVQIVAVAHLGRRPGYWKERLR